MKGEIIFFLINSKAKKCQFLRHFFWYMIDQSLDFYHSFSPSNFVKGFKWCYENSSNNNLSNHRFTKNLFHRISIFTENSFHQINDSLKYLT